MMRLIAIGLVAVAGLSAQGVVSGRRPARLVIRNAMIIEGNGTPAARPKDIVIENGVIRGVVALGGDTRRPTADAMIDASGKYVMPGLINAHGHIQDERGGIPQPVEYELKLWLSCGITTVRDVGSDTKKT